MPRVVTGRFRGAILQAPEGDKTRPTTDKVKEALFSIIQSDVPDSEFLDLFAGSGQIGIEALSRGARHVTLVERSGQAAAIISRNISKIKLDGSDEIRVHKKSVAQALELMGQAGEKFDIIFMDPPYRDVPQRLEEVTKLISDFKMLADGGMLIAEHDKDCEIPEEINGLKRVRSCSYGITVITFFKE
ncbi:MAG: 16S rRNA (guanine(966)-N(2))-methyltransferase RsmD [Saccharofermentans sp.]|jgi:16S rRNA (guanine966-N2)-methyltransferase|nr:16S rRNA (guanine(966)-N(2))-methyltransferase RsmD [Clostridiales bacterium]MCR5385094.1 16S rRNA (guanine(966)-N(2))-methyltransferase RsmD [Saccharofermentans sp.]